MSEVLEAALEYRNKYGFSIIPLNPSSDKETGKKPLVAWAQFQERIASEEEIRAWWGKYPYAMVGIVTGKLSGIMVVDGDTDGDIKNIETMVGDLDTVNCTTVRGQHWYFRYHDGVRNSQKESTFHVRGEGGYVAAPPSKKSDGKVYSWVLPPGAVPIADAPPAILAAIFGSNNSPEGQVNRGVDRELDPVPKESEYTGSILQEGNRDRGLFHAACTLFRGGMAENQVREIIYSLAKECNPPFPEKEAEIKIQSAKDTTSKIKKSFMANVQRYVNTTDGYFGLQEVYFAVGAMKPEDKDLVRSVMQDLKGSGVLEKYGKRTGEYRRLNEDVQVMDFMNAPTEEFRIDMPLGIHTLCKIFPGNIIIVAGSKSAGKTGFMLNVIRENQVRFKKEEIIYMNSEMGETELKNRLTLFNYPLDSWKFTPISRPSNWSDLITGERKIFIIDYLEMTDQFWLVAEEIRKIHEKLKDGVAVIAIQKDPHAILGRGGSFSIEKSRLYVSLNRNLATIVDAKAYRNNINPRDFECRFTLAQGCNFRSQGGWYDPVVLEKPKVEPKEDRRYGTN